MQRKVNEISKFTGECKRHFLKVKLSEYSKGATAHVKFITKNGSDKGLTFFGKELETITAGINSSNLVEKLLMIPQITVSMTV